MNRYSKIVRNYEFLVIPTKNIVDIYDDETGAVKVVVDNGVNYFDDETMMLFADDVKVDGKYYLEDEESE